MSKVVIDTNVLLRNPEILNQYDSIILPIAILEELDGLKKGEGDIGFRARQASKAIEKCSNIEFIIKDKYDNIPEGWNPDLRDNKIILTALENNAKLISDDLNVRIKSRAIGVDSESYFYKECDLSYKGFKEVEMNEEDLANWYINTKKIDKWNINVNEYLLIKQNNEIIDIWVRTKEGFRKVIDKKKEKYFIESINSISLGKMKPKDKYQICVVDSLINNPMTMIKGRAGSGKSLLTIAYAISMIEKCEIDKIIIFTNPLSTKNSCKLGFYPGTKDQKLLDSSIGHMLSSKFGDIDTVEGLIRSNKLILLPFSDIRGYDTTGMKALIWISEAQNLDIDLMKLAIQRVGDDCKVVIDGDYDAQVDSEAFSGNNNGMKRVSEIFRGEEFYGEIELQNTYRSKWCEVADKL